MGGGETEESLSTTNRLIGELGFGSKRDRRYPRLYREFRCMIFDRQGLNAVYCKQCC